MLKENFYLCYVDNEKLMVWVKENKLDEKDFSQEKLKWKKEVNKEPNFFSNTELLATAEDILLLQVSHDSSAIFLAKIYQPNYQIICQKVFSENKNVIIVSQDQWNEKIATGKSIVLLKDEETSKECLADWLEKINNN